MHGKLHTTEQQKIEALIIFKLLGYDPHLTNTTREENYANIRAARRS